MRLRFLFTAFVMMITYLYSPAEAAPISYKLWGFASDSAGATTFTNSAFTWTLSGDTADLTPNGAGSFFLQLTSALDIAGVGMVTPDLQTFVGTGFGLLGHPAIPSSLVIFPEVGNGGIVFAAPGLAGYNGITPIGPLPVTYADGEPLGTDKGDLSFTTLEMMFEVQSVPEPLTLALFGTGLAAGGAMRRLRRARI